MEMRCDKKRQEVVRFDEKEEMRIEEKGREDMLREDQRRKEDT